MGKSKSTPSTADIARNSGLTGDQSFDNIQQIATGDIYQDERPNVNRDGLPIDYERSPTRNGPQSILKRKNNSKLGDWAKNEQTQKEKEPRLTLDEMRKIEA